MLTSVPAAIVSRTTNQGNATYAAVSAAISAAQAIHRANNLGGTAMPTRHGRCQRSTATCQQKAAPDIDAIRYSGYACMVKRHSLPPATFHVSA